MSEQRKVSFKQNLIVSPGQQTSGQLEVKNIVIARDLPMNGIYVPLSVFKSSLELWTNAPIVAPRHVGIKTAANTFGTITRAFIDGDKVKADGVINLDKIKTAYPVLFNRLISGQPISGSIYIDMDGFGVNSEHNHGGRKFSFIATAISKVYHYALLQDQPGACDVVDGCGVNLSASKNNKEVSMTKEELKEQLKEFRIELLAAIPATIPTEQCEDTRPGKLDVTYVTPREFSELVGRLTANETTTAKLEASLTDVNKVNKGLEAEIVTLKAEATQAKNNSTGVGVVPDDQQLEPEHNF